MVSGYVVFAFSIAVSCAGQISYHLLFTICLQVVELFGTFTFRLDLIMLLGVVNVCFPTFEGGLIDLSRIFFCCEFLLELFCYTH